VNHVTATMYYNIIIYNHKYVIEIYFRSKKDPKSNRLSKTLQLRLQNDSYDNIDENSNYATITNSE